MSFYIPVQFGVMDMVNIRYARVKARSELAAIMLVKRRLKPRVIHQSKIVGY